MMPKHYVRYRSHAMRAGVVVVLLAMLAACGRKGDITDFKPPPAKEQSPGTGG